MIKNLPTEVTMVSDTESGEDVPEQPVIIADYNGGIGLIGWDGDEIYIPDRMVNEVVRVMKGYSKQ